VTSTNRVLEIGADGETLPTEDVLTGRTLTFGKSGGGKSNTASVVIEELLEDGHPVMIIDTDGEYYGLKEEYDVLHATGDQEGDIQVGPEHADRLATLAIEESVPVILDVSAFLDPEDADELVGKVARALFAKARTLRRPFLLVVEECHEYIPQQGTGGYAAEHITRIAKRGRKHGLGILGISQRPASVDKDVVTQASLLIWHRLTYSNDTGVVRGLYGSDVADEVEDLEDGEAYVEADWYDDLRRYRVRRKRTYDAGATPGLDDEETPELRSIDAGILDELREEGETARTREARIEELETELEQREERIEELQSEKERLEDYNAIEDRVADSLFSGLQDLDVDLDLAGEGSIRADVMEVVEQRNELDEEVDRLQEEIEERDERIAELEDRVEDLQEYRELVEDKEDLRQLADDLRELVLDRYPDVTGVEDGDRVQELRQRLESREDRVEELEQEIERVRSGRTPPTEPEGFDEVLDQLRTDAVQEAVDRGASNLSTKDETVWRTLIAVARAEDQPVHSTEILASVPLEHKDTVNRVLSALADEDLLMVSEGRHGRKEYSVDQKGLDRLIAAKEEDERVEQIATEVFTSGGGS